MSVSELEAGLVRPVADGVTDFIRDHGRNIEPHLHGSLVKRVVGRLKGFAKDHAERFADEGAKAVIHDLRRQLAESQEKCRRLSDAHKRLAVQCGKADPSILKENPPPSSGSASSPPPSEPASSSLA